MKFAGRKVAVRAPAVALLVITLLSLAWVVLGQEEPRVTIQVSKSVPSVTTQGRVLTALAIKNNSTEEIFGIEVQEYFNTAFILEGNVTVRSKDQTLIYQIGRPSVNQFILPFGSRVSPGETVGLEYWSNTITSGDFQVPASLVFFTYQSGSGPLRKSIYSNALLVHIPTAFERAATELIPYFVSVASVVITSMAILNLRRTLKFYG
ncbi:MAG: hypothetical protein HYU39_02055 [Thaumarchaeota archaeon]|nr:hypothetical protein [Nitrososphaerota archaeon]